MKRNKLLLLLVLLAAVATGAWAQTTVTEPAAAIFAIDTDGTTQDFGSVKADATAQKTFKITNSGNKPLFVTISNPADFTAEMTHNAADKNVYFTDALGWGDIHVYYWNNGPEWPGVAMTELYTNEYGQKVYYCELPDNVEGVIFHGNGNQTGDINEPLGKAYYTKYDNTVGTWSYNNCVPAGMSSVLTVTMNTATLGSKSGNINLSFDAKNATSFTIPCTGKTVTYYNVTMADGTEDADNWTITPKQGLSEGDQVTVTYTGTKRVKSVKAVKKVAGPVTYTELKGGEVLHVGDIITPTEQLQINGDMYLDPSFNPYTVIRANIIGETSITVTPADDGAYYVLMYKAYSDENEYLLAFKPLPVTNTSDGILVRYDGVSGNYKQYTFTVHEP